MIPSPYLPILEVLRGDVVESMHFGAIAVMDAQANLIASYGDPSVVTFTRSSAKPFQALSFLESGGQEAYHLTLKEVALICASHSGMDEQVEVVRSIQAKTGVSEEDLLCGAHMPYHKPTAEAMQARGEAPTQNHNNCSGKHTGMLAYAHLLGCSTKKGLPEYVDPDHPVQRNILQAVAQMAGLEVDQVAIGVDGCSAPNFAMPLRNAALAFAHLCDPSHLPSMRAAACRTIVQAMTTYPEMIGGPESFDTRLMQHTGGRLVAKAGAEGFWGIGLLPGAIGAGSPAFGIAFKISDGDLNGRARPAVALEILRQVGAMDSAMLASLADFGPEFPIYNRRNLLVGRGRPCFMLDGDAIFAQWQGR
ncbi:MAG: asparaginase [Anaerolineales bacterium]|nr:asparaginase [Anaerolineales bacterium]